MKQFKAYSLTKGANTFCGPAALSALTGQPVEAVTEVLRQVTGKTAIKGVSWSAMERAIPLLGYQLSYVPLGMYALRGDIIGWQRLTLAKWLKLPVATTFRTCGPRLPHETFLVCITDHYLVVRGRKIVDNCNMDGVFLRKYRRRRATVCRVWLVEKAA